MFKKYILTSVGKREVLWQAKTLGKCEIIEEEEVVIG
jgi:hypothetical protein